MSVPSLSNPSGAAQPRARRRSANAAASRGDPLLFTIVDEVIEKLKLLDYEDGFCVPRNVAPLTRSFFASHSERGAYFPTFSALVLWLLSDCLEHEFIEWTEFDDPTAIANSILEECKLLGFSPKSKPTDLTSGSAAREMGEILNHLSSKALSQRNFSVQAATYPQQTDDLDDDDAIDEDDIQDDVGSDEDDIGTASSSSSAASSSSDDNSDDGAEFGAVAPSSKTAKGGPASSKKSSAAHKGRPQSAILKPKVDPRAWLMELERVESRLKLRAPPTSLEWRTHLAKSTTHSATLGRMFPEAKTRFNKIAQRLSESAQRVATKESHINQEFSHVCAEFREKQSLLKASSDKSNALNEEVSALATRLETVSDEVEMTQAQMDSRNSSMTDMSPLRQIQDALSSLRKELARTDLRVGVTRQALLAAKSIEQKRLRNESRVAQRTKKQQQAGGSGGLHSAVRGGGLRGRGRGRGRGSSRRARGRGGSNKRRGGLPRSSKVPSLRARGRDDGKMSSSGVSDFLRTSSSSSRENLERENSRNTRDTRRSTNRAAKPLATRNRAAGPPPPQSTRLDMSALARFSDGTLKAGTGRRGVAADPRDDVDGGGLDGRPESRPTGERVSRQNSVRGL